MKYLIDTCILSELKKPFPNGRVIEWLQNVPSERLFMTVITVGEIRKGLAKMPPTKKRERLTAWLNTLIEDYRDRILNVDLDVSENWGETQGLAEKAGRPMPTIDGLIAATARVHNMVIVTRNEEHFQGRDLPMLNPWNLAK